MEFHSFIDDKDYLFAQAHDSFQVLAEFSHVFILCIIFKTIDMTDF